MINYPDQNSEEKKEGGKVPVIICSILTVWALLALIIGMLLQNSYVIIVGIIPAAIYETWRTEGFYTKAISAILAILSILEIFVIKGIIKFNFLAPTETIQTVYLQGYFLPLVDAKFFVPALMLIASIMLIYYTYGIYTKWLSITLTVGTIGLLYLLNKQILWDIISHNIFHL